MLNAAAFRANFMRGEILVLYIDFLTQGGTELPHDRLRSSSFLSVIFMRLRYSMRAILRRMFTTRNLSSVAVEQRRRVRLNTGQVPIYAIGDIHGCYRALLQLEHRIRVDVQLHSYVNPLLIYLGDYVDRGPDSRHVIEHLLRSDHNDGIERLALCGNHDDLFLKFLENPMQYSSWLDFGATTTMLSYGVGQSVIARRTNDLRRVHEALVDAVPASHVSFLKALPSLATHGQSVFVHAGVRPSVILDEQVDEDLLWIREPFLTTGPQLPVTVIHGHSANLEPVRGPGRICIDTGCYATGRLTAIRLFEQSATIL